MAGNNEQALLELAVRCEKATGPDMELATDIWRVAGAGGFRNATASLDAAMTLVSEGWGLAHLGECWQQGDWHVTLAQRPSESQRRAYENGGQFAVESVSGEAATPALALCAAALRAQGGSNDQS